MVIPPKSHVKVSVIIPAYNVECFIEQCVDSLLAQSFDDFDLILVDDGSTDRTGVICDEYTKKDVRVKVVHQENTGLPTARKVGLENAQGEYVLFVDADDWVDPNHLESLVGTAEQRNADVVICGFNYEYPRRQIKNDNTPITTEGKDVIIECLNNRLHAGIVFKLVKKNIFVDNQLCFPKYNFFEDMYLTIEILLYANKIESTGLATYHYRFNDSSETHEKNTAFRIKKFNEFILNMQEVFDNYSLWTNESMRNALFQRINKEKLELLILPYSAGDEIRKAYQLYSNSWKEYKIGLNLLRLPNYLALRHGFLLIPQLYKHFRVVIRNILKGT